MESFNKILQRLKLDHISDYVLTGTETEAERNGTFQERLELVYNNFLNSLEDLFPSANRNNNELISSIATLIGEYSSVYLEAGILVGIQFCKNLEESYRKFDGTDTI